MQLVLAEHHRAIAGLGPRARPQGNKEAGGAQIVGMLGQGEHQAILQAEQAQQGVAMVEGHMRAQILGVLILHYEVVTPMALAVLQLRHVVRIGSDPLASASSQAAATNATLGRKQLLDRGVVVSRQGDIQRILALDLRTPVVAIVQEDLMVAGRLVRFHYKGVVLRRHKHVQLALGHVNDYPDVHVHEARLDHKEDGLARLQGGWLRFAFLCGRKNI